MTNKMIILTELIRLGWTDDEIKERTIDTYAGWKRKGFQVRKGEKAVMQTMIWKPCKKTIKDEEGNKKKMDKMYLVKASFFAVEQVDKLN